MRERYEQFPFGETWIEEAAPDQRNTDYRFTGKELDPETGFYYFGARYYEPRQSQWLSVDPALGTRPDPQSHWVYSYAWNSPTRLIDPDGREISGLAQTGRNEWSFNLSVNDGSITANGVYYSDPIFANDGHVQALAQQYGDHSFRPTAFAVSIAPAPGQEASLVHTQQLVTTTGTASGETRTHTPVQRSMAGLQNPVTGRPGNPSIYSSPEHPLPQVDANRQTGTPNYEASAVSLYLQDSGIRITLDAPNIGPQVHRENGHRALGRGVELLGVRTDKEYSQYYFLNGVLAGGLRFTITTTTDRRGHHQRLSNPQMIQSMSRAERAAVLRMFLTTPEAAASVD